MPKKEIFLALSHGRIAARRGFSWRWTPAVERSGRNHQGTAAAGPVNEIHAMWGTKIDQVPGLDGHLLPGIAGNVYLFGPQGLRMLQFPSRGTARCSYRPAPVRR